MFSLSRLVIVVAAVTLLLDQGPCPASAADEDAEVEQEHPGYFDQWFTMKKDDQGRIPKDLYTQWSKYDERKKDQQAALRLALTATPFTKVEYHSPKLLAGRTRALLIDRSDGDRVFAGAVSGGLWRSDDRGATWSPVNDKAASLAVSDITQSPFNANIIYYSTGEARANTAGVQGDGVFKSTDGGMTFTQVPSAGISSGFEECWCVAHSRTDANTVYVGTESAGLLRSTDGGTSWSVVYEGVPVTDVICFSSGSVLFSASGTGIFHSPSGTAGSFTEVSSPSFPPKFQRIEIEECRTQPSIVYAAYESPDFEEHTIRFCVSRDGGLTWTARSNPQTRASYDRYCFMLGVHPCDPQKVICGGVKAQFSSDGGMTWDAVADSHNDYHVLATFPDDADRFLVGNDGGVYQYKWSDTSAAAIDRNTGYQVSQFYAGDHAPSGDFVIGGTQDNGTWKLSSSTRKKVGGNDGTFCHISQHDPNLAYASTQRGRMYRSEDFMSPDPNWQNINTDGPMNAEKYAFVNPFQINRSDDSQLYARTAKGFWRTSDKGATWTRLSAGTVTGLFAIACSEHPDPTVYYGGEQGSLFRIDSAATAAMGGEHDLSATVPASVTNDFLGAITIHPAQAGTILVGFSNFVNRPRIWKVTDADTMAPTWHDISGDLPPRLPVNFVQIDPTSPDSVFYAATDFGLYYTFDGGTHWIKEQQIPNVSIHQLKLRPSDRTMFAFTHGRGIWKLVLH